MKNTFKLICLLIVGAMLLALLAACGDNSQTSETPSQTDDASSAESNEDIDEDLKWKDASGKYTTGYTKEDLGGYKDTFTVLVQGNAAETYQNVDFTTGEANTTTFYGTFVDEGVSERNRIVEEQFGVKIIGLKDNNAITTARSAAQSGDEDFDAVLLTAGELATLSGEGKLAELTSLEDLQLDAPWWDEKANEAFSISNKLYFTTGDITLLNKITTGAFLFNKELISQYHLENPYDLVYEHKWTFDKLIEIAKQIPENNPDDIHGLLIGFGDAASIYQSLGGTYTVKNADDLPILSVKNTQNVNRAMKLLDAYTLRGATVLITQECPDNIWVTSFAEFNEGRVVFRYSGFSAANKMRDYAVTFGIVPMPLYDEQQENYISPAGTFGFVGIMATHQNPEWVAKMLSIVACGAKNYVTPAYYERTLTGRDARDNESEEMLDIVFENLCYDIGTVYDLGGLTNVFYDLTAQKSTAFSSKIDTVYSSAEKALQDAINLYSR